jgi:hypothetical protein
LSRVVRVVLVVRSGIFFHFRNDHVSSYITVFYKKQIDRICLSL